MRIPRHLQGVGEDQQIQAFGLKRQIGDTADQATRTRQISAILHAEPTIGVRRRTRPHQPRTALHTVTAKRVNGGWGNLHRMHAKDVLQCGVEPGLLLTEQCSPQGRLAPSLPIMKGIE